MIIISTVLLTLENPMDNPKGNKIVILKYFDIVLTTIFTIESLLKIFVFGMLFNGPKSYLRSAWNIMDFVIVVFAIISLSASNVNFKFIKALRMLRVLRPLRMVSRNQGLKVAVQSLINAVPGIGNVMVISLLFLMLFGILGTNFFKGKFRYCDKSNVPSHLQTKIVTMYDCFDYGGEWKNHDAHFDNVASSMLTLFNIMTTEGWIAVMWNGVDAVGPLQEPIKNNSIVSVFFFIAFIIVGSLFVLNLFVGVVINTFNSEKERLGRNHLLTPVQVEWIQVALKC